MDGVRGTRFRVVALNAQGAAIVGLLQRLGPKALPDALHGQEHAISIDVHPLAATAFKRQ